jgi:BirA family biotin operon repressor/biotin-[acetyl-CoA-carboxylase] ligase
MIDLALLSAALGADARRFDADALPVCDSTNAVLLARAEAGSPTGTVVIAASQTHGRGRHGRTWVSAPGDSLTFSLLWRFAEGVVPLGLSLAVGVAVTSALAKVGAGGTALKWPNDVMKEGRKLAGILIELMPGKPHAAVIGIGLNLRLPAVLPSELHTSAAGLDLTVDPHRLLAVLLSELRGVLDRFATHGFACLRDEWCSVDAYRDTPVRLISDFAPPRLGICRGVDKDGALLFESAGKIERVLSGDLSLRAAP